MKTSKIAIYHRHNFMWERAFNNSKKTSPKQEAHVFRMKFEGCFLREQCQIYDFPYFFHCAINWSKFCQRSVLRNTALYSIVEFESRWGPMRKREVLGSQIRLYVDMYPPYLCFVRLVLINDIHSSSVWFWVSAQVLIWVVSSSPVLGFKLSVASAWDSFSVSFWPSCLLML